MAGPLSTREFDISAPRSLEVSDEALDVPSFLKHDD
jgi:hypothetical protein